MRKHYKPEAVRKVKLIGFNVTKEQYSVIEDNARASGQSVAEFVRGAVMAQIQGARS